MAHEIELNNRYLLSIGDNQTYTVCHLDLTPEGTWKRTEGKICKGFLPAAEYLLHYELFTLSEKEHCTLETVLKLMQALVAEMQNAKYRERAFD